MVNWNTIEEKVKGIGQFVIDPKDILSVPFDRSSYDIKLSVDGEMIDFDLTELFAPLGTFWKVLYGEGDFDTIIEVISKYWMYKLKPSLRVDFLNFDGHRIHARSKLEYSNQKVKSIDLNRVVADINESFTYDKVVVGSDLYHLELQFLNSFLRKEMKQGDFVDCGLFVSVNGGVKIASGVNRLVCTNGVTERFNVYDGERYNFGDEFSSRAVNIANWLSKTVEEKIPDTRTLSVVLNDFPKWIKNEFWENWSGRIDLGSLTWYAVINDISRASKETLSGSRYKSIQLYSTCKEYEEECRCPVCQSEVVAK